MCGISPFIRFLPALIWAAKDKYPIGGEVLERICRVPKTKVTKKEGTEPEKF
jgi:hypothetical protein